MERLKRILLLFFLLPGLFRAEAQVEFFGGTFDEALARARTEGKGVFIDFYTVWCGPCKLMSTQVFTDPAVGEYFNRKFVNYQINAEDKAFAAQVKLYGVQAYPTLVFLDASGQVLASQAGAMDAPQLLRYARRVCGELPGFEEMYGQLKSRRGDTTLMQAILTEAPDFLAALPEGSTYDRWELRIDRLFGDYCKAKTTARMMNPADLSILMTYRPDAGEDDPVMAAIMADYEGAVRSAGKDAVDRYVFVMNTGLIQRLAEKGDPAYVRPLARVKDDLRQVYESLVSFNGYDAWTGMKCLYDAKYSLYGRKDAAEFIRLMDTYFTMLGTAAKPDDYRLAVDDLSQMYGGKFSPEVTVKCTEWVTRALQGDMDPSTRMEMLLMLGDCHKMQKNTADARKCYNQAYVISLQFGNPGLSAAVQRYISDLGE